MYLRMCACGMMRKYTHHVSVFLKSVCIYACVPSCSRPFKQKEQMETRYMRAGHLVFAPLNRHEHMKTRYMRGGHFVLDPLNRNEQMKTRYTSELCLRHITVNITKRAERADSATLTVQSTKRVERTESATYNRAKHE